MRVAVFGLGSMGYGMAASRVRAGHDVWGRDVAPPPVARLKAEGGQGGVIPILPRSTSWSSLS